MKGWVEGPAVERRKPRTIEYARFSTHVTLPYASTTIHRDVHAVRRSVDSYHPG